MPRPGLHDRTPVNLYNRPENVLRVDRTALRAPVYRGARPAARPAQRPNNVFAGKDGKVYQRDNNGTWQVNEGRKWKPVRVPVTTPTTPRAGTSATAGGKPPRAAEPTKRPPPEPAPAPRPAGGQVQPQVLEPAHPAPPKISRTPGDLEREYRARERASQGVRPSAPAPAPRPGAARQEKPKQNSQPEPKPKPKG